MGCYSFLSSRADNLGYNLLGQLGWSPHKSILVFKHASTIKYTPSVNQHGANKSSDENNNLWILESLNYHTHGCLSPLEYSPNVEYNTRISAILEPSTSFPTEQNGKYNGCHRERKLPLITYNFSLIISYIQFTVII